MAREAIPNTVFLLRCTTTLPFSIEKQLSSITIFAQIRFNIILFLYLANNYIRRANSGSLSNPFPLTIPREVNCIV